MARPRLVLTTHRPRPGLLPATARSAVLTDEDMAGLQRRVDQTRRTPKLPLLVLDAMLPRQRLRFPSLDPVLEPLAADGEVGVLGRTPHGAPMWHGVVAGLKRVGAEEWELRGQKHFKVLGPAEAAEGLGGVTVARVELATDEALAVGDVELAASLAPLVKEWLGLVEGTRFERFPQQIHGILADLGAMPPAEDANERAFWVAALVNPLPGLGVAYEIRPAVLAAPTVRERLEVVLKGIMGSIGHVSGKKPLF